MSSPALASPPAAAPSRARLALTATVLAVATLALYGRTAGFEFVGLDDDSYVLQNRHVIDGLTGRDIAWAFTESHSSNWHPLTWMSHMLDVELFGVEAGPAHAVNAVLHALGAALLFLALVALTRREGPSLVVAALFAVHPTHVESVAWISERKDVLAGVFWMLTLLAYARWARRPSPGRYAAVFLALALGLMAKPMAVTLPFVLLLLDLWPLGRWTPGDGKARRRVLEKLPLFALVAVSSVVTVLVQAAGGSTRSFDAVPLAARAANALASYLRYVEMNLWPVHLAAFYPHPAIVHPDALGGLWVQAGFGAALLVAGTWGAGRVFRRAPFVLVGWLWFLGTLVPVIGLLQVGNQSHADRYLYLPSIGLFVAVVFGAEALPFPCARARLLPALAALVLVVCGVLAWRQIGTWHDTRTLFTHANAVTEDNYLAWGTLGNYSYGRGELERARGEYERSLRIKPDHIDALNNLGVTLVRLGDTDEGLELLRKAVRIAPRHPDSHANLGNALVQTGDPQAAEAELREAIRLAPERPEPRFNLGRAYLMQNALEEARVAFEEAVRLDPGLALAHANLGGIAVARGEWDDAERHLARALALDPDLPAALFNRGLLRKHRGDTAGARREFQRVLRLVPRHAGARAQLQALGGG